MKVDGFDDISKVHYEVLPGTKKLIWFKCDRSSGKEPVVEHDIVYDEIVDV